MKNVVFMINSLGRGGAEKALVQILNNLDYSKYNVKLVVFKNDGGYINDIPQNIEVIKLFNSNGSFISRVRWAFFWRSIRYFPEYIKSMIEGRLDLKRDDIIVSFLEGPCTKIASMYPNNKITWMHTDYLLNRWPKFYYKSVEEELSCYNRFNKIVFVSKNGLESFNKFFNNEITVEEQIIHNPVDSNQIVDSSLDVTEDLKSWLSNTEETVRVISVGRLVDVKRLDWLIKAQKQFNEKNLNVSTTIIGEGKLLDSYRSMINDNKITGITLLGFKKNPFKFLKYADIYTSTSVTESYPLSIAEAYILDLPVIATENSGSKELSDNGKYALLVESNYSDFFKELEKLVLNFEFRDTFIKKSVMAKQQFKLDSIINEIESMLDRI